MSRIGKKPIPVSKDVDIQIEGNVVQVKGSKGQLKKEFHKDMLIKLVDGTVVVERPSENKLHKSLHGLTRTLISNMIEGVTKGFEKTLELSGVGYRAQKQGNKLVLNVGFSRPVEVEIVGGIEIDVPDQTTIVVKGIDKELVGAVAAKIRAIKEPEPYKGKGIKYKDEYIRRKAGKTGKK
ncbi:50S ribosomal protein L6 [Peptococcaceae bacterium]|nr:50S ribosomal protein L6 [Peptococcaceae bacterium]